MKKVIQTNIGGRAFNVDEDAYLLIKDYLDSLKAYFSKEEGSTGEIIEDIENRLAELLILRISGKKEVIDIDDANYAIKTLGKIEDFEFSSGDETIPDEDINYDRKNYRKLFRDPDNYYLGGVCSGLGSYLNIDPLWLRIIFIALIFANGFGILLYIIFWIVVPKARTTAEKLQMKGEPVNIENIKRSVADEYGKVSSTWQHSASLRKTRNVAEEIISVIGKIILIFFKIILFFVGLALLLAGVGLMIGVGTLLFAKHAIFGGNYWFDRFDWQVPDITGLFSDPMTITVVLICLIFLIGIPIIALIIGGIKLLFNLRSHNRVMAITGFTAWILALIILVVVMLADNDKLVPRVTNSDTKFFEPIRSKKLVVSLDNNAESDEIVTYTFFNYNLYYSRDNHELLGMPHLVIRHTETEVPRIIVRKSVRSVQSNIPDYYFDEIEYAWNQDDSLLVLDKYFTADRDMRWSFPEVELVLEVPEGTTLSFSHGVNELIRDSRHERFEKSVNRRWDEDWYDE